MNGGRITRKRNKFKSVVVACIILICFQLLYFLTNSTETSTEYNDSNVFNMVPSVFHKFLTPRPRNISNTTGNASIATYKQHLTIPEIKHNIAQYNLQQTLYNEDIFGPLQNDSIVVVVQVRNISNFYFSLLTMCYI